MMTKIRSVQDSWAAKSILILTALSFMSLFGVSGYLSSAGKNRPIIKVDDIIVYQDEIRSGTCLSVYLFPCLSAPFCTFCSHTS